MALKILRYNGEYWYVERPLLLACLYWLCWPGGWLAHRKSDYFSLHKRLRPGMLAPVSLFGHRITFFGWGTQVRCRGGYLDETPADFIRSAALGKMRDVEPEMKDFQQRYAETFRKWENRPAPSLQPDPQERST